MPHPILEEIKLFLSQDPLKLSRDHDDDRINASVNEKQILEVIRTQFNIEEPPPRQWYDFIIKDGLEKIPVNIKVSTFEGNDNVQCKLGIYYAVTGHWPDFSNEISWESYFAKIAESIHSKKDKDYYFLVVKRSDPTDIITTSLKRIKTLTPNGNNLPFQCKWGDNRNYASRSHEDATKFILGVLGKSCQLRANIKSEFETHISKFI